MILDTKQTTVAYRCPHCGVGVMSVVGVFSLSAEMMKLKCSCGHSEMTISRASNGKIRFSVPCMLCPSPHNFTVNSSVVFSKELFVLPCPYSDINIAVMGSEDHVKAELSRSELELLDILEKSGIDNFEAVRGENFLTDPQVLDIVTYVIRELDEEKKITCRCDVSQIKESLYDVEILEDSVRVTCRHCGASKLVPANSLIAANEFLNADKLELE